MVTDVRACFIGDSFVAGVGDPEHRGWVGRIAARSSAEGVPLTVYNLGVRRQTSEDVRARWSAECVQRLPTGSDSRVVLSFGVNDATEEDGALRVPAHRSAGHLAAILTGTASAGWPVLVVGPPPIADRMHNRRTLQLDTSFRDVCAQRAVSYVSVVHHLLTQPVWMSEVTTGDGAHPGAAGYQLLAELIWPHWRGWLGAAGARHPAPQ